MMRHLVRSSVLLLALAVAPMVPASSVDNVLAMPVQEREAMADAAFAEKRYRKARKEYKILARLGSKRAQLKLSEMRANGLGVKRDLPKAWAWATMAAEFDRSLAADYRQQLWADMDDGEHERARDELRDLHGEYSDRAVAERLRAQASWRKDLRSVRRGVMTESMVEVSSGCDIVGGLGGGGGGRGALSTFGGNCTRAMSSWGDRDKFELLTLIQFEMERRLQGGSVELGEFELLDDDATDADD